MQPVNIVLMFGESAQSVEWLRYAGWLVTTPVLLLHVNDLASIGMKNQKDLNREHVMFMCNQLTLVIGMTGSFVSNGYWQAAFFSCSFCFFCVQNYWAFLIYGEVMRTYPTSAVNYLKSMAIIYFGFWHLYPLLWALGPEAAGFLTPNGSRVLHALSDLFAKNLWGYLAFYVREKLLPREAERRGMKGGEFLLHGKIDDLTARLARAQRSGASDPDMTPLRKELVDFLESGSHLRFNSFTSKGGSFSKNGSFSSDGREMESFTAMPGGLPLKGESQSNSLNLASSSFERLRETIMQSAMSEDAKRDLESSIDMVRTAQQPDVAVAVQVVEPSQPFSAPASPPASSAPATRDITPSHSLRGSFDFSDDKHNPLAMAAASIQARANAAVDRYEVNSNFSKDMSSSMLFDNQ